MRNSKSLRRSNQESTGRGYKVCALANSITLGFNLVLCGEMGSPLMSRLETVKENEMDALEQLFKGVSANETSSG